MKEKNLIPLTIIEEKSLVRYKKKSKIKRFFIRLLTFCITIVCFSLIVMNFDLIADFVKVIRSRGSDDNVSISSNTVSTSTNSSNSSQVNTDINNDKIPSDAYEIIEKTYNFSEINNETEIIIEPTEFNFKSVEEIYQEYGTEAPVVLIIHSACLEAYSNGTYYSLDSSFYSGTKNVREIGDFISKQLNSLKINSIHIDNVFANGAIISSKAEYEKTIEMALNLYPSIEYVFDISRDTIINDDLTMIKPVTFKSGVKMAQMKISVGSSKENELWKDNLCFATLLASQNSDLVSDVVLTNFPLSQDIEPISLKIDIGAFSNSFEEAMYLANEFCVLLSELIS